MRLDRERDEACACALEWQGEFLVALGPPLEVAQRSSDSRFGFFAVVQDAAVGRRFDAEVGRSPDDSTAVVYDLVAEAQSRRWFGRLAGEPDRCGALDRDVAAEDACGALRADDVDGSPGGGDETGVRYLLDLPVRYSVAVVRWCVVWCDF